MTMTLRTATVQARSSCLPTGAEQGGYDNAIKRRRLPRRWPRLRGGPADPKNCPSTTAAEVGWRSPRGPMHDTPPTGPAPAEPQKSWKQNPKANTATKAANVVSTGTKVFERCPPRSHTSTRMLKTFAKATAETASLRVKANMNLKRLPDLPGLAALRDCTFVLRSSTSIASVTTLSATATETFNLPRLFLAWGFTAAPTAALMTLRHSTTQPSTRMPSCT